jgi:hypothetical protein
LHRQIRLLGDGSGATKLYNPCYEWEYPSCASEELDPLAPPYSRNLTCVSCEGLVTREQGGWVYRYYAPCPVGQYRGTCSNECVFPDAGNVRGQVRPCSGSCLRGRNSDFVCGTVLGEAHAIQRTHAPLTNTTGVRPVPQLHERQVGACCVHFSRRSANRRMRMDVRARLHEVNH